MSKSFFSCQRFDASAAQQDGVWVEDSCARVLLVMAGIELLTSTDLDPGLDPWAAMTARKFLLAAIHGGSGTVNPELYEHRAYPERLGSIRDAFVCVLRKLDVYGEFFSGRFWFEHNMLEANERIPDDLPTVQLRHSARAILAHINQTMG